MFWAKSLEPIQIEEALNYSGDFSEKVEPKIFRWLYTDYTMEEIFRIFPEYKREIKTMGKGGTMIIKHKQLERVK